VGVGVGVGVGVRVGVGVGVDVEPVADDVGSGWLDDADGAATGD